MGKGVWIMPDLPIAMSLDETLLNMVKDAIAEPDLTKLKEKFEKIIFRWAGVDRINDISEMFGNANQSGFKALALYDTYRDGRFDAFDDVFKNLKLWQDWNGDGRTDEGELLSLSDVGI